MQDHTMGKKKVLGVSKIAFKVFSNSSNGIQFNTSVNLTLTFAF